MLPLHHLRLAFGSSLALSTASKVCKVDRGYDERQDVETATGPKPEVICVY